MAYKYNKACFCSQTCLSSTYQKSERALLPIFIFTWKNNNKTCIELQKQVLCEQQDLAGPQQDNQQLGTCVLKPIFDHWFDLFDWCWFHHRRQQPHSSHQSSKNPRPAANGCLHRLALTLRQHLAQRHGPGFHPQHQLHRPRLSALLQRYQL